MRWLKTFTHAVTKSLTDASYYNDVVKANMDFSIKYYLSYSILLALLSAGVFAVRYAPEFQKGINTFLDEAVEMYPADLIVSSKDGSISVNKPEPYIIPFPAGMEGEDVPVNVVVFYSEGTINDLEELNTFALVNSENIIFKKTNGIEAYDTSEIPNGEMDKSDFEGFINSMREYVYYVPVFMVGAILLGYVIYYWIARLIYNFWAAFLLWVFGKFRNLELPYGKYYQMSLHTMTFPLLAELILYSFDVPLNVPYWFLLLHMIAGVLAVSRLNVNNKQAVDRTGSSDTTDTAGDGSSPQS